MPMLLHVCDHGLKEMEAAVGVEVEPCSPPPAQAGWTLEL